MCWCPPNCHRQADWLQCSTRLAPPELSHHLLSAGESFLLSHHLLSAGEFAQLSHLLLFADEAPQLSHLLLSACEFAQLIHLLLSAVDSLQLSDYIVPAGEAPHIGHLLSAGESPYCVIKDSYKGCCLETSTSKAPATLMSRNIRKDRLPFGMKMNPAERATTAGMRANFLSQTILILKVRIPTRDNCKRALV